MFTEFMGLPTHVLLVHAAVVFVPLLGLAGILYAVVPPLRARLGWVAGVLAVVGPVSALLAKISGERFRDVLVSKNYPPQILDQVAQHQEYGDLTCWLTLGLAAATGMLVFAASGHPKAANLPAAVRFVLAGLVVVLGVLAVGYVYLTGDSGAQAVWTGVL